MSNQHLQHDVHRETSANTAADVVVTGPARIMGVIAGYDSDPTAAELSLVFSETNVADIYIWITKGGPAPIPLHGHLRVPAGETCTVTLPAGGAAAKGSVVVFWQEGASA